MPWLKLLHISAVIAWSAMLLYVTVAISVAAMPRAPAVSGTSGHALLRPMFTLMTTPAALVAIGSGTAIFLLQGPVALWLLAKLTVVGLLVLGHGLFGMLILRTERRHEGSSPGVTRVATKVVGATTVLWLGVIAWLVLGKAATRCRKPRTAGARASGAIR